MNNAVITPPSYAIRIRETERCASLMGIQVDLTSVQRACELIKLHDPPKNDADFHYFFALSTAAIVRYARCFVDGKRQRLAKELLSSADAELSKFHDHIMNTRHRHIAHSVNPFEENDVTVQIDPSFTTSSEITQSGVFHSSIPGLLFSTGKGEETDAVKLILLAGWVLDRVVEEIRVELENILRLVCTLPLSELKKHPLPKMGNHHGPADQVRKRP